MMRSLISVSILFVALLFQSAATANISPRIYNALNELQQKISEQPDVAAIEEIKKDLNELKENLKSNALGLALTLQTLSQLSDYQGDFKQSQLYLLQAINIEGLKLDTRQQLRASLGFSYFREEEYKKAISIMHAYIDASEKNASAGVYALLAASYYGLEEFQLGLPFIEKACSLSKKPKEHWLQMAFTGHYQNKAFAKSLSYVNQLVFYYPNKKDYWNQKSGLHQLLENYPKAALSRALMHTQKLLNKESEFINFGQLMASQGNPYAVGLALKEAVLSKTIEPTEKVLRLEYQAWLQAKEMNRALDSLQTIYLKFNEAKDGITLMQFYLDKENWKGVNNLSESLLGAGIKEADKGRVLVMSGISLHKLNNDRKALLQLSQAVSIEETSSQAKGWMNYIKQKGL